METIYTDMVAQGDVVFMRIKELPKGLNKIQPKGNEHVVAHSESGHHHAMVATNIEYFDFDTAVTALDNKTGKSFEVQNDGFANFMRVDEPTLLYHNKSGADAHKSITLGKGDWVVKRGREYSPEGWRKMAD